MPASLGARTAPGVWFKRHLQVLLYSIGLLYRNPLNTLMTASVIGIALALPAGLHLLVANVLTLSEGWTGATSISVFLKDGIDAKRARELQDDWLRDDSIAAIDYIDPEQALAEFERHSGFKDALQLLDQNPLPGVLLVQPAAHHSGPEDTAILGRRLRAHPAVDLVQVDLQWVQRLQAITRVVQRGTLILAVLLGLAVLLVIGNTIRLEIQNRHAEIEISALVGGTRAFIRRPFLYTGLCYGFSGGIIASLLLLLSVALLQEPIQQLAGLYGSGFQLRVGLAELLPGLIITGSLLGLGGAGIATTRHLNLLEPGN